VPQPLGYLPPPMVPMLKSHVEERPYYGLVAAGSGIFGGSWMLTSLAGLAAGAGKVAVPVVGPLIVAGELNSSCNGHCDTAHMATAYLVLDTLVQTAGLVMLIAGAATKHKVTIYDRVAIAPSVGAGGAGLAAFGRF
jgi:hypothetical protein